VAEANKKHANKHWLKIANSDYTD